MKKKIIALAGIALLFAGCSSDDDGAPIDYSKLAQQWYNVSSKTGGETYPYDGHEVCGKDYIDLAEDGTATIGDVVDCTGSAPVTDTETGSYYREGNVVTLVFGGFSDPGTIEKLTATTLEVSTVYDFDGDGDEETVISVFTSIP